MGTAGGHHHGLCLTLHGRKRHLSELLYDNRALLVDDMLVIVMESLYCPCSRCLFIFRVIGDALSYLVTDAVRRITQQHILDKAFLERSVLGLGVAVKA